MSLELNFKMMTKFVGSLCVLFLIAALGCESAPTPTPTPTPQSPIAFFRIVMTWPTTLCLTLKDGRRCVQRTAADFRMHGLWPAYANETSAVNCPNPPPYRRDIGEMVKPPLATWWPGYAKSDNLLWAEEWYKHGSCSGLTLMEYFSNASRLAYNLQKEIRNAFNLKGIVEGRSKLYTPKTYWDALLTQFNYEPQIWCKEHDRKKYLNEVCIVYPPELHSSKLLNQRHVFWMQK
ncbi:hypothetical protein RND81_14G167600 [Saponaria officinalis]|uniref:Uncharacterized protein n=1 Tax=Saponaria officinalis TaxID=3572 RepID=A0AAW1GRJ0_SAPOF